MKKEEMDSVLVVERYKIQYKIIIYGYFQNNCYLGNQGD
ncbi:unnamed protein product [Paramecium sonneborni]|uniref:Uncharacterized protein n=1 Tax=Paramecium sonneborni TaxID=65129 RepID=A0A8S1PRU4_9CILI|nr:unnamed protein product [Paramecium sonneborni]